MNLSKKEYDRIRYLEKKESIKARVKNHYLLNSESIKAYQKKYAEENKEKLIKQKQDYHKKRYAEHPEIYKEVNKKSRHKHSVKYKKRETIANWKTYGIICDFDEVYTHYINCIKCEYCDVDFKPKNDRCLDHDHSIIDRNNVRGVLCKRCNLVDVLNVDNLDLDSN